VSPTKNPTGQQRAPKSLVKRRRRPAKRKAAMITRRAAKGSGKQETSKAEILRTTHAHRSRAHASSRGRRRQARRDTK
jgi:hypothetical protein